MEQFQEAVTNSINQMISSGKLEKIISEKIEKSVESVIDDSLRSYSDFGQKLQKIIEGELTINAKDLNIEGYNKTVLKIVKSRIESIIHEQGAKRLEKDIEEFLSGDIPSEITLSELVEELKDEARNNHVTEHNYEITCIIGERSYSSRWVYLDSQDHQEKYQCDYKILVSDDGSAGIWISGDELKNKIFIGPKYGFEKLLFQLYAHNTKIIIDEDNIDVELADD